MTVTELRAAAGQHQRPAGSRDADSLDLQVVGRGACGLLSSQQPPVFLGWFDLHLHQNHGGGVGGGSGELVNNTQSL